MKKSEKLTVERMAKKFPVFINVKFSLPFPKKDPPLGPTLNELNSDLRFLGGILRSAEW